MARTPTRTGSLLLTIGPCTVHPHETDQKKDNLSFCRKVRIIISIRHDPFCINMDSAGAGFSRAVGQFLEARI